MLVRQAVVNCWFLCQKNHAMMILSYAKQIWARCLKKMFEGDLFNLNEILWEKGFLKQKPMNAFHSLRKLKQEEEFLLPYMKIKLSAYSLQDLKSNIPYKALSGHEASFIFMQTMKNSDETICGISVAIEYIMYIIAKRSVE